MLSVLETNITLKAVLAGLVFLVWANGAIGDPVLFKGTVNAPRLNIRKAPSLDSDVVMVLGRGDAVEIIEQQGGIGGWLRVTFQGRTGYARNRPQYILLSPSLKNKPDSALPQKKEAPSASAPKSRKETLRADIQAQEKLVESFSQKEMEIIEGLNEIDQALNKNRLKVQSLSLEIDELTRKIETLGRDKAVLSGEIARNRDYADQRLRSLYKMNMLGRLDVAGLPASVFDFLLIQKAMKKIVASDFHVLLQQHNDLQALEKLEQDMTSEVAAKTRLESELNDQIRINHAETEKKEMILKDIRRKKNLSLAAVASLKQAAVELDKEIASMRAGTSPAMAGDSFSNHRGRLMIPVKGDIISTFGPSTSGDYKSFTFQKGIDIKVQRGEPVKSVFRGDVMFAQWLKGYGNLMIINHGDNYYTLYAHLDEMFKKKGDRVETGDVIATAGDTGSIKGLCLHFELRHHGEPVDPLKWLRKGA